MSGLEIPAAIAGGLGLVGSGVSAYGTILQGNDAADALQANKYADFLASQYKAKSLDYAAQQARAASQQQAIGQVQDKTLALSKAQALAAASGGGAGPSDTSVVNLEAGIEKQGEYNKAMSLFEGETRARELGYQANLARIAGLNDLSANDYQSSQIKRNSRLSAMGTILSGASSAANNYARFG